MTEIADNIRQLHLLSGSLLSKDKKPVPYWPDFSHPISFGMHHLQIKGLKVYLFLTVENLHDSSSRSDVGIFTFNMLR